MASHWAAYRILAIGSKVLQLVLTRFFERELRKPLNSGHGGFKRFLHEG